MMMDFEVKRCTRRCAASDRELQPGETFYSVLIQEGAELIRQDFAESQWHGPPEGAVGVWKSQMPSGQAKRVKLAPNEVMRNLFNELEGRPEKRMLRYLLALMLVRRRVLQLEGSETNEQGIEQLCLRSGKDEPVHVDVAEPADAQQAEALQEELAGLLYAEPEE